MGYKVWIDAGHGGSDSGACGNGFTEAERNLKVALLCGEELERHGIKVGYTRKDNSTHSIGARCRMANEFRADLFVSIHHNAGGGVGSENIYSIVGGISKNLADNIMREFVSHGRRNRRVFTQIGKDGKDYFGVIRDTHMPSVITEYGFIDNEVDIKSFNNEEGAKLEAISICKGILTTLGVVYKGNNESLYVEEKRLIQEKCQFSNPDDVFKLMDTHKYAKALYEKWVDSYK